jgi:hypothetical protein
MNDERQGLPSASILHRLAACPGSWTLCKGLPETESSPEAEFGTVVHAYLAGNMREEDLTPEENDMALSCLQIEERLVADWRGRLQIPATDLVECRRKDGRLWLYQDNGDKYFSGETDTVYIWNRHALVLDYKTGRGEQAEASDNLQLRAYAVLVVNNHGWMKTVEVGIIQPLVTHSPTLCRYGVDELIAAQKELLYILSAATSQHAELETGDHCKYCRAQAICPKVKEEVQRFSALTINASGLTIPDEDMAALRARCGAAKKMIGAIEAECFRRAEANPEKWRELGWEIREGSGRRAVEDVTTVSERLNAAGASWQEIAGECTITITSVETLTRKAMGLKGKAVKDAANRILDGCTTTKTAKPSLKRIGSIDEE